jgi:hypothetical protein
VTRAGRVACGRGSAPLQCLSVGLLPRSGPGRAGVFARGLVAGAAGAVAMDSVQFARYRRGGGRRPVRDWEFTVEVDDWSQAPATAQIGRQIIEGVARRPWPVERAGVTNNVVHWGYCMAWGAVFGLVQASRRGRRPRAWHGLPLGATVWLSSYVIMPLAGLYRPIWEYDVPVLAKDLGDHLAYGTGVSVAYRLVAGGPGR